MSEVLINHSDVHRLYVPNVHLRLTVQRFSDIEYCLVFIVAIGNLSFDIATNHAKHRPFSLSLFLLSFYYFYFQSSTHVNGWYTIP